MRRTAVFTRIRDGAQLLVVDPSLESAVRPLGLLEPGGLERALRDASDGHAGRARTAVLTLAGGGARLHLRPVRHGGWLGRLWGDASLGLRRPLAEIEANARLAAAGAPVPRPVLVAARRRFGPLWRAAVGTLHEEDAPDALTFLRARPARARLLRAAAAAGAAVGRFHAAGGRHADLQVANLLIRESGAETRALLVDLDRARVGAPAGPRERMDELMRLYRSLRKRELLECVGAAGCARFLSAYTDGDRALRRALLRDLPRHRRRIALHALGYRIRPHTEEHR